MKDKPGDKLQTAKARKAFIVCYVLVLGGLFLLMSGQLLDEKINTSGDNAQYYTLGKALAEGDGYRTMHQATLVPHNHYPPGYPVLIALTIKLFSDDVLVIKKVNQVCFGIALVLVFMLAQDLLKNVHLAFVTTLLVLFNYHLWLYAGIMMSEMPFMLCSLLAVWCAMRLNLAKPFYKGIWFWLLLVTVTASFYIRTAGLALLLAMVVYLALKKRSRIHALALSAGFVMAVLPWQIRSMRLGGSSYVRQLLLYNPYSPEEGSLSIATAFERLWLNLVRYITRELPSGLFNFVQVEDYTQHTTIGEWLTGIVILVVIVYGVFRLQKPYRLLIGLYLAITAGLLLCWPPIWTGVRFMLPLTPILLMVFVRGVFALLLRLTARHLSPVYLSLVLVAIMLLVSRPYARPLGGLQEQVQLPYPDNYKNYFQLAEWSAKNLPDSALVCTRKGALFYMFSGRATIPYQYTTNTIEQIEYLKANKVDYLVAADLGFSSTNDYLMPAINQHSAKFELIRELSEPSTYLFRFHPDRGYEGDWREGKRQGWGTYTWADGRRYEGNWIDGRKEGEGTMFFTNGQSATGIWTNDKISSAVTLRSAEGELINTILLKDIPDSKLRFDD